MEFDIDDIATMNRSEKQRILDGMAKRAAFSARIYQQIGDRNIGGAAHVYKQRYVDPNNPGRALASDEEVDYYDALEASM